MQSRIAILIFMSTLFQIATSLQGPILAVFVLHMGGSLASIGEVSALYVFSFTISSITIATKFIKYRKLLLNLCYLGYATYAFLMYLSPSVTHIYMLQVLCGMVAAMGLPSFVETLMINSTKGNYTRRHVWSTFFGGIFGTIASVASGHIAHHGYLKEVFLLMVFFSLSAFVVSLVIHKWVPPTDSVS